MSTKDDLIARLNDVLDSVCDAAPTKKVKPEKRESEPERQAKTKPKKAAEADEDEGPDLWDYLWSDDDE